MKIYIFDRAFENFDMKDPFDIEFLSLAEGN
jgi:hypothetical protein